MGAIGLNPIRLDAIGLDPIRFNAIRLGVPGASSATDRPYISPDVLSALTGVWIADGKSNTDPDRNIIKNKLPGRGGDFELLNFAYKLNSGYGKYEEDFTQKPYWYPYKGVDATPNKLSLNSDFKPSEKWIIYKPKGNTLNDFKVRVSGIPNDGSLTFLMDGYSKCIHIVNGDNDIKFDIPTTLGSSGFWIDKVGLSDWSNLVIEQIPSFQGSLCTDGVNDMIVSQNPVSEMLGGSNELTVVSMMCQISDASDPINRNNWLFTPTSYLESRVEKEKIGKTGIYGYTSTDIRNGQISNVNTILGDKNDYIANSSLDPTGLDYFSVEGFENQGIWYTSSVAWYWTFIAKRVLTTDEINQVIVYYNLDKYVKPDIYYDVKKQGLTNDNHAQFGDKLIDYSGNSRDLQLFNIGWNPGSGIGKYVTNFGIWSKDTESNISYNSYSFTVNGSLKRTWLMWYVTELPSFKIKVSGINSNGYVDYGYYDNGSLKNFRLDKDGIHTLPPSGASSNGHGFKVNDTSLDWTGLVIEQIPDFAGALCFDGVDDYGQVTGMPIYKDYTVVADREFLGSKSGSIVSKSHIVSNGAFIFETFADKSATTSFGSNTLVDISDFKKISYQSKYIYNGNPIQVGIGVDGDSMCLGVIRENDSRFSKFALWSLLLFPYSLSEFLLERQLKKHKLGTLYPGMVEFRPIVKSNIPYSSISYSVNPGEYVIEGSTVTITITLSNSSDKLDGISSNAISDISISGGNGVYEVTGKVTKSPQKIDIVISSYLTMLDNETLITNETLIKNE
jgi:hypothetical protein